MSYNAIYRLSLQLEGDRVDRMVKLGTALTVLALLSACSYSPIVEDEPPAPEPTAQASLADSMHAIPSELDLHLLGDAFDRWYDAYTASRVVELTLNVRGAVSFGPWSARYEPGTEDAAADGALTEWADDYYITHDWSDYGQEILSMQPGDVASVNGRSVTIDRVFNYPKNSFYEEIRHLAGEDTVVFQTCYPDSDYNRIAYGRA